MCYFPIGARCGTAKVKKEPATQKKESKQIASKILHKKAVHQSTQKDESYRIKQGERSLNRLLDKICLSVGLQLADWDIDDDPVRLVQAILDSDKLDSPKAFKSYEIYDECFNLLKAVGITVDYKYNWYTNLKQLAIKNKN
jgi:hypothetical protein